MNTALAALTLLASQNPFLAYLALYIVTIFLGNLTVFVGFWVYLHGHFGWWGLPGLIFMTFLADLSADLLWYYLGRIARNHPFGQWLILKIPHHNRIETHLHNNSERWIFMSKFLYASTFPIIFSVGWAKIEFKKFFKISIYSIIIWVPLLYILSFSLISGLSPLSGIDAFRHIERLFLFGIILFISANYLVSYVLRRLFKKIGGSNCQPAITDGKQAGSA